MSGSRAWGGSNQTKRRREPFQRGEYCRRTYGILADRSVRVIFMLDTYALNALQSRSRRADSVRTVGTVHRLEEETVHRPTRLTAVLVATAAIAAGVAACGSDDNGGSASSSGSGAASTKPSDVKVGVVLKTFANDYWTAMRDGVNAKAKELGLPVKIDAAAS